MLVSEGTGLDEQYLHFAECTVTKTNCVSSFFILGKGISEYYVTLSDVFCFCLKKGFYQ